MILKRYHYDPDWENLGEDLGGEWVKYEDAKKYANFCWLRGSIYGNGANLLAYANIDQKVLIEFEKNIESLLIKIVEKMNEKL